MPVSTEAARRPGDLVGAAGDGPSARGETRDWTIELVIAVLLGMRSVGA